MPATRLPLPGGFIVAQQFLRGYHTGMDIGADGDTGISTGAVHVILLLPVVPRALGALFVPIATRPILRFEMN